MDTFYCTFRQELHPTFSYQQLCFLELWGEGEKSLRSDGLLGCQPCMAPVGSSYQQPATVTLVLIILASLWVVSEHLGYIAIVL